MHCTNCSSKAGVDDKFCKKCGKKYSTKSLKGFLEGTEAREYSAAAVVESSTRETREEYQESPGGGTVAFKTVAGNTGTVVGVGFLYIIHILAYLLSAAAGIWLLLLSISSFMKGSIIIGILSFIAIPIVVGLLNYLYILLVPITLIVLLVWGAANLFGFQVSFGDTYGSVWAILWALILCWFGYLGTVSFKEAVKENRVGSHLASNWFYIILYLFFLWIFIF